MNEPNDNNLTKKQLRKQMKRILTALSDLEKDLESEKIIEMISYFINASPHIKTIASYAAMPLEINLEALHSQLPEIAFCYPKCSEQGQMEFYLVSDLSEMRTSQYGIREPDETNHKRVDPETIDLFLCPAYAYNSDGKRLGKGGGFYDRYLLKRRPNAITLGVVFPCQKLNNTTIPTDAHDILIDRVL